MKEVQKTRSTKILKIFLCLDMSSAKANMPSKTFEYDLCNETKLTNRKEGRQKKLI